MKKHKNGFTLAEVLITLMIIGIISAITIPSIIQNTNKQELYAKFKKNYSVIKNALELAQVQEGMTGLFLCRRMVVHGIMILLKDFLNI